MKKDLIFKEEEQAQFNNVLEQVLRKGARELLQQSIETIFQFLQNHKLHKVDNFI